MGLVTLDASGQVAPGVAESWMVTDDGLSLVFRLRPLKWRDGTNVTGQQVAAALRRALAAGSRNAFKPLLSSVQNVRAMTGRVVEIDLRVPRPNLLQLLAQPEFAIRRDGTGLGPWRETGRRAGAVTLSSLPNDGEDAMIEGDKRMVEVRPERATLAIARFRARDAALVMGGTVSDWPLVRRLPARTGLRLDPAQGLLGIGIRARQRALRDPEVREALAMAIDRASLAELLDVPNWAARDTLLPGRLDVAAPPTIPRWAVLPLAERQRDAAAVVRAQAERGQPLDRLRIAAPDGPGLRLILARLTADLRRIGIALERVPPGDARADLVWIDEIAPNDSANWYFTRTGCEFGLACSEEVRNGLLASRASATLGERARLLAEVDLSFARAPSFIVIGNPVRWSLVAPNLSGWRENPFASHPFAELVRAR